MIRHGGLRAAFAFGTRLPLGTALPTAAEARWTVGWLPTVGAAVGFVSAGAWVLARPGGPTVAAVCAVLTSVVITGALHEDGLADTADAFGGGHDRAAVLRIFKDPRVGTFGVLALLFSVLLRVALLAALDPLAPAALVLAHTVARATPAVVRRCLPYVSPAAAARTAAVAGAHLGAVALALAVATAVAVTIPLAQPAVPPRAVATALAFAAIATAGVAHVARRRIGGVTGDVLGATEQLSEAAVLSALALGHGWPDM